MSLLNTTLCLHEIYRDEKIWRNIRSIDCTKSPVIHIQVFLPDMWKIKMLRKASQGGEFQVFHARSQQIRGIYQLPDLERNEQTWSTKWLLRESWHEGEIKALEMKKKLKFMKTCTIYFYFLVGSPVRNRKGKNMIKSWGLISGWKFWFGIEFLQNFPYFAMRKWVSSVLDKCLSFSRISHDKKLFSCPLNEWNENVQREKRCGPTSRVWMTFLKAPNATATTRELFANKK